jgi:uncharacterized protein (TIRG00374 family)
MLKFRYFLGLILILIAVFVVYPEFKTSIPEIPGILAKASKSILIVIVLLQLLTYLSDAILTKILLKIANHKISLSAALKISVVDTLANLTFPLIGGQVIKYHLYRKLNVPSSSILFIITSWTMFFYLAAALFFIVSIFFIPQSVTVVPLNVILLVLAAITIVFYILVRKGNKLMLYLLSGCGKIANKLSLKFRKKEFVSRERLSGFISNLEKTFLALRSSKKEFIFALGISFLYYFCDIMTIYFSFLVFGLHINIFVIIFGFTVSTVLSFMTAVPYLPGVVESSLALVFVKLGYPANISLLASLLFRIFSYWLPMPFGLASYFNFRKGSKGVEKIEDKSL